MRIRDFTLEVEIFKSITDESFCYLFEFSSEKGIPHTSVPVALLTWRGFGFYYPTFGSQKDVILSYLLIGCFQSPHVC